MKIEFKPELVAINHAATYGIRVWKDGLPDKWLQWCDATNGDIILGESPGWEGSLEEAISHTQRIHSMRETGILK